MAKKLHYAQELFFLFLEKRGKIRTVCILTVQIEHAISIMYVLNFFLCAMFPMAPPVPPPLMIVVRRRRYMEFLEVSSAILQDTQFLWHSSTRRMVKY